MNPGDYRKEFMQHRYAPPGMETAQLEELGEILQERLADLIDLSLILKHVHWNVVGDGFIAVHELMDMQDTAVRTMVDDMAERISTIGGIAAGLAGQVAQNRTAEDDYALDRGHVLAHLGALDVVYTRVISGHRAAIGPVAKIDPISEDLLISQTRTLEKHHWFIRAHLEDIDGRLSTDEASSEEDAAAAAVTAPQPGEETTDEEVKPPAKRSA